VTASLATPVLRQDVVIRYEELRQGVLSGRQGVSSVGLTLFVREGMAKWIRVVADGPSPRSQPESTTAINGWSCDVRAQAASILAGILLSYRSETTRCTPMGRR
jgi:hypothetical protein